MAVLTDRLFRMGCPRGSCAHALLRLLGCRRPVCKRGRVLAQKQMPRTFSSATGTGGWLHTMQGAPGVRLPPIAVAMHSPSVVPSLRDRAEADAYVNRHGLGALMREHLECLLLHRPDNPERFLLEHLTRQVQQQDDEAAETAKASPMLLPRPPAPRPDGAPVAPQRPRPLAAAAVPVSGACRLSLRVQCDGPDGVASERFSTLVAPGDGRQLASLEAEAAALVHAVWAAPHGSSGVPSESATAPAREDAAEEPAREAAPKDVHAAQEKTGKDLSAPVVDQGALCRLQERLAQADVDQADAGQDGDLSVEELLSLLGPDAVEEHLVRQLFHEIDRDHDGKLALHEFKSGLNEMCPSLDGLSLLKALLHEMEVKPLIAKHLLRLVQSRLPGGHQITTEALQQHLGLGDLTRIFEDGLTRDLDQR